ncbi:hypothetical protein [Turicibacter sp.]|uniref:hypothetical protein n=1 Tax=Turicibacter sp. TaxID=2049042 RepID=UPI001B7C3E25|nr:hypothetical protein [Turicibacter sp.]MBP3905036.1 hypothetical protein [Turicibacter sp.]MBP3908057.1 hypothetical protein [Turicibacter sp.]
MKLKILFTSVFCLMLATYGGTTTFASELEQNQGIDVSVETADNGIITLSDGDKEIGVFFPEEVLDDMPDVHQSLIKSGLGIMHSVNASIKPSTTKSYPSNYFYKNDTIAFSVRWNYLSSTSFGVTLPSPYNPVTLSTTTSGTFIGTYVSKINGTCNAFIKNNSTTRTSTYTGNITYKIS